MAIIPKHEELEKFSDQDLIEKYNEIAQSTVVGTAFYREEYVRRQTAKQTNEMMAINKSMQRMTIAITILTIVNVILVAYTIIIPIKN
ncbi:MAG: hypothetical protein A2023_00435 [Sulfuricurvum sp. GWF2_44_89]|uniref:Uncharacterized protein n=1 Tax=Sulfuricurvum kujiense TaxID=148813 RepID=A0A2D3WDQ3_9BACT|nr:MULTISPECIES: hypothetical protein [Sulfuricurvum]OHD77160.1 MAG: hypothetical protein A2023_00435 [Sulfuricurvum sp. GWF2_44_89]OHD92187.1 MAG: hypothetical protein A2517_10940 [Sulfuricurvum sp. RIFOXYD12_FULL_44_77]OHD99785.1 MAG: hypothetical protein A2552_05045 [Sulfuricurvum sp. RIFOXYD2_FULL_44_160]DAB38558.1 MAG TPA: hypothetical protein CFH83_05235 [Sulfuricurvum kujiense]